MERVVHMCTRAVAVDSVDCCTTCVRGGVEYTGRVTMRDWCIVGYVRAGSAKYGVHMRRGTSNNVCSVVGFCL